MSFQPTPPTSSHSTSSSPTMNPSTTNHINGIQKPLNPSSNLNPNPNINANNIRPNSTPITPIPNGLGNLSSTEGIGKGVPAFLVKLYSMINEPKTDELIYWSEDGKSFFIPNSQKFGGTLLPQFFKHANFTSFVRQLNMYGFKKVPHLQAAVLSSFAPSSFRPSSSSSQPSTPELWEFVNPKFMRSHPELLGSITRKKSAKEIAAAQHAHGGEHDEGGGKEEDVDMDGEVRIVNDGKLKKEDVSEASVSRALTLMHATNSSLEKEMQALKSSNEMLWRQWMLSREDQMKSEKKVDRIMRFLAGQFGGMNMVGIDGESSGSGSGNGNVASKSTDSSMQRVKRLGNQKMIGDGIRGLEGSPGEEVVNVDEGSDGDNDIWEFDDGGNLVKMERNKPKTPARPPARVSTPTRRFNTTASKSRSASPHRFVNLDGSPEEPPLGSFDQKMEAGAESPIISAVTPNGSGTQPGTLFPTTSVTSTNPKASSSTISIPPSPSNAMTPYQPSINLSNLSSNLDPAILQLPLGALLGSTAGAQFLASLSHIAALGLQGQQQSVQQPALQPQPAEQQTARVTDLTPTPYPGTPATSADSVEQPVPTTTPSGENWNALASDLRREPAECPTNGDAEDDPLRWLNASATGPSAVPALDDMDFLDPAMLADAADESGEVDWNDPDMAQLLCQLENPNLDADMAGRVENGMGGDTSAFDSYDMGDKHLDFDEFFREPAGEGGLGDGMGGGGIGDGLKEPTRKKRKTDDRW